jgi:hypothetical protein
MRLYEPRFPRGRGLRSLSPGCVTAWQSRSWNALARVCRTRVYITALQAHFIHSLYDGIYAQKLLHCPSISNAHWGAITSGSIVISSAKLTLRIITSPAPLATVRDIEERIISKPSPTPFFPYFFRFHRAKLVVPLSLCRRAKRARARPKAAQPRAHRSARSPNATHTNHGQHMRRVRLRSFPNRHIKIGLY